MIDLFYTLGGRKSTELGKKKVGSGDLFVVVVAVAVVVGCVGIPCM